MKKLLYSAVASCALVAMAPAANAAFFITLNATPDALTTIGTNNNFQGVLASAPFNLTQIGLGLLEIDGPGTITFEFMGSESGFNDTFETLGLPSNLSYTENSDYSSDFGDPNPFLIGSRNFMTPGALSVRFTNSVTGPSENGSDGFGVLLGPNFAGGTGAINLGDVVYLAYDDEKEPWADDNHDDLIIRATFAPVPEPETWALMLVGFGAVGYSLRRRPSYKMAQAV